MRKANVRQIPLNLLFVDHQVQRGEDTRRSNRIAADLRLDAIGVICVSEREDGTYSVIDGQHRVAALRITGLTNEPISCEVYTGLDLADEAAMFRVRNETKAPLYIDRFRVRLVENDNDAESVMDILRSHGWLLDGQEGSAKGRFSAIQKLERIYLADRDSDPTAAERVIAAVTAAWGHDESGVDGRLIEGLGKFLLRYGTAIEQNAIIDRLRKYPGGPGHMLGDSRALAKLLGVTISNAIAEKLVELYNKNRRTRALPPWRS